MRDKLNRFIDNTIGNFQEVSYLPAPYQCMDLVYEWVFVLDIPKATIQHQFAYEVYTKASDFTRQYFDIIPNTPDFIPEAGDIAVFKGGEAGHIGIVVEATKTKITKFFDQNKPLGTNANLSEESYTNCLGFLRPKVQPGDSIPPYLKTLAQEAGFEITNESAVRSFWEKGKKYDEDTQSLRAQLTSTNEILSAKTSELANEISKVDGLKKTVDEYQDKINTIGSERDKASWEATQYRLQAEKLSEENKSLQAEIEKLRTEKPLYGYSWKERFLSLFRGGE